MAINATELGTLPLQLLRGELALLQTGENGEQGIADVYYQYGRKQGQKSAALFPDDFDTAKQKQQREQGGNAVNNGKAAAFLACCAATGQKSKAGECHREASK